MKATTSGWYHRLSQSIAKNREKSSATIIWRHRKKTRARVKNLISRKAVIDVFSTDSFLQTIKYSDTKHLIIVHTINCSHNPCASKITNYTMNTHFLPPIQVLNQNLFIVFILKNSQTKKKIRGWVQTVPTRCSTCSR